MFYMFYVLLCTSFRKGKISSSLFLQLLLMRRNYSNFSIRMRRSLKIRNPVKRTRLWYSRWLEGRILLKYAMLLVSCRRFIITF
jgi:hypothetical protein